jgi:hypothetical protein
MLRSPVRTRRRPGLLAGVLTAALVGAVLAPSATASPRPAAPEHKSYTASASPRPVSAGAAVQVTLTNCGPCGSTTSTQPFASAEVRWSPDPRLAAAAASVSRFGWSVGQPFVRDGWTVLRLTSSGVGTTTAVEPGSSVVLSIPVAAEAAPGPIALVTQVKQSNDFSGSGNDFARVGDDPTVEIGTGPPARLRFLDGASTVQVSGPATGGTGVTPVLTMCPAPRVQVEDAVGTPVAVAGISVALAAVSNADGVSPGLRLDGSTTLTRLTASDGVATFGGPPGPDGPCSTGVSATQIGLGFGLSAAAQVGGTPLTPPETSRFDVLQVYGDCTNGCSTGTIRGGTGTTAQLDATSDKNRRERLTFAVGLDGWEALFAAACDPDPGASGINTQREVVTVDLADHDKTLQLRWSKRAVQWHTNNGASQWRVCLAAAYPFVGIRADGSVGPAVLVPEDESSWYVAALLPCGDIRAAGSPCLLRLLRQSGEQVATVHIPDVEGDPRMI